MTEQEPKGKRTAANIGFCAMAIRIYSQRQNKTQRHIGLARPLRNLFYKKKFNPGTYPTDQPTIVPVIYASFAEAVVRYCW